MAGRGWLVGLTALSLLSALAAVLGLGLSAMASDDMARGPQAHRLQLLVLAWLLVSVGAPALAWWISARHGAVAFWCFLPVALVGAAAVAGLVGF